VILAGFSSAQVTPKAAASDVSSEATRGLSLTEKGRCKEALLVLKKVTPRITDKQLRYHVAMATARCAMSLDQEDTVVGALLWLKREFPHDPEVLYITTHYYSQLAARASQELAATAPNSTQALQLEAEAFESQGKWDEAATQYKRILEQNPQTPGIHYRLGRIWLSRPENPQNPVEARQEFEKELKIDPASVSAEFMLGEIARQAGQWDEAINHFSKATQVDESFAEAFLALGVSLNSAGRFADAIPPLQSYVKMLSSDPAGHYQLAVAYNRTGRKMEAAREMNLQREAAARSQQGAQAPPR
jgi:tetratricopeptide (TPR) repeat protein